MIIMQFGISSEKEIGAQEQVPVGRTVLDSGQGFFPVGCGCQSEVFRHRLFEHW